MRELASQILSERQKRGLTQEEVANQTDIPLSTYRTYERGTANPPADRADKIRSVLGITPDTEGAGTSARALRPGYTRAEDRLREIEAGRAAEPDDGATLRIVVNGTAVWTLRMERTAPPVDVEVGALLSSATR